MVAFPFPLLPLSGESKSEPTAEILLPTLFEQGKNILCGMLSWTDFSTVGRVCLVNLQIVRSEQEGRLGRDWTAVAFRREVIQHGSRPRKKNKKVLKRKGKREHKRQMREIFPANLRCKYDISDTPVNF